MASVRQGDSLSPDFSTVLQKVENNDIPGKNAVDSRGDNGLQMKIHAGSDDTQQLTTPPPVASAEAGDENVETRVFKRRWLMLGLFCLYSFSNSFQWIHLNIIANVILRYYNTSLPGDTLQQETAVDWLSMVYMLAYVPLVFPATWLMDSKGLRVCNVVGSFLNAVGAWVKCASVSPDRFGVLMFAQTICSVAQIWVLGMPAPLAAAWFGPNEVSTATSLGVFGNQVGAAVGFLLPPVLVPNSPDLDQVGWDISIMMYVTAGVTTAIFIAILIGYRDKPPVPPSRAQLVAIQTTEGQNYLSSLGRLIKTLPFVVLVISYGVNVGCYYAIATLLNAVVLEYFPGEEVNAGRIGLTIVITGIIGAVLAGIWLDKTRTFKGTSLGIYFMSMACMVVFTFTMDTGHIWVVFITAGSFGFFMTGYLPVGFEFAAELTFPEPEGTSSGLLNASAQIFGIIFTLGMRAMMNRLSVLGANIAVCVALLLGTVLTALIRANYKRQAAGGEEKGNRLRELFGWCCCFRHKLDISNKQ
ncbi:feline leukemia virus subgroup C receptor-related protein 2-like isoform X4 [Haliotis rubra]|uniref:feline leukemia virus subgroup C receptor-related protein 2-like isoform X4 n=2 Tax=Haliotis rubra TaxID=36100 RepID=UPI001EE4F89E|nr:feline leukemia virus subgroup C receptor-related protein 2-like isoform X4 [Haliotis rubra]